jgi:hypothetical protein
MSAISKRETSPQLYEITRGYLFGPTKFAIQWETTINFVVYVCVCNFEPILHQKPRRCKLEKSLYMW